MAPPPIASGVGLWLRTGTKCDPYPTAVYSWDRGNRIAADLGPADQRLKGDSAQITEAGQAFLDRLLVGILFQVGHRLLQDVDDELVSPGVAGGLGILAKLVVEVILDLDFLGHLQSLLLGEWDMGNGQEIYSPFSSS